MRPLQLALTLALCTPITAQQPPVNPPNVLVIMADDLGANNMECYASDYNPQPTDLPPTPNISSLASRGVRFQNAYACANCSPSRACLMTGRYPVRHMIGSYISSSVNDKPIIGTLKDTEWTIADAVKANGYEAGYIGKWHLSEPDPSAIDGPRVDGGWEHFAGSLHGKVGSYTSWNRVEDNCLGVSTVYATKQQTDDAISWIGTRTNPWVCVLSYNAPHAPFHDPPLHPTEPGPLVLNVDDRGRYKSMVKYMDLEIGRLVAYLAAQGLDDDTVIIFLGDNGTPCPVSQASPRQDRQKGTPYEGGVKIPMIIAGPGVLIRQEPRLAHITDLYATILDLTSSTVPSGIDGVSLVPYLDDTATVPLRDISYSEMFEGNGWPAPAVLQGRSFPPLRTTWLKTRGVRRSHFCIRDAEHKLIGFVERSGNAVTCFHEFYNLSTDPFETTDLCGGTIGTCSCQGLPAYTELIARVALIQAVPTTASVTHYGRNCAWASFSPDIGYTGLPVLGSTFTISVSSAPPSSSAVLSFDLNPSYAAVFQSCEIFSRIDGGTLIPAVTDAAGAASIAIAIPASPVIGKTWYHQWVISPLNTTDLVVSGALAATVGFLQ